MQVSCHVCPSFRIQGSDAAFGGLPAYLDDREMVVDKTLTKYPGVAQLVGRHIWDVEAARSNRATRTKVYI